jgi:hypothetical protein
LVPGRTTTPIYADTCSALAVTDGRDPTAAIHEWLSILEERDAPALQRDLVRWQLLRRASSGTERIAAGLRLIDALSSTIGYGVHLTEVMVDVAAAYEGTQRRELALQAAHMLRRRRGVFTTMVESMCRCADLLQETDPTEARLLLYAARRWVVQALPHVPDLALHSYVYEVPAHRQLLGDDAEAAAAGRFDFP